MENFESMQLNNEDDDEFYEKIEAPKFVDLKAPDLSLPDDRSWFCLRVGCDQKHEEEMDPDALYKSFVIRVMAARSPNLRLRKALNKQAPSTNMKCPLSAPAKSSKARISRLTTATSISQKMGDAKVKVHFPPKLNSTPNDKAKQSSIAAKALTTPVYKKRLLNPNPFQSVRRSKTKVAVPKNRAVAKTLVFQTSKKTETMKNSLECRTPVTEICAGLKKLEITSQRKHVLQNSCKSSKDTRCDPNKSLPSDRSRTKLSTCKVKTRAEMQYSCKSSKDTRCDPNKSLPSDRSRTQLSTCKVKTRAEMRNSCKSSKDTRSNPSKPLPSDRSRTQLSTCKAKTRADVSFKSQEVKFSRCLKRKVNANVPKCHGSGAQKGVTNESSHMEIECISRDDSLEVCSVSGSARSNESNGPEECLISANTSTKLVSTNATREESIPSSVGSPVRENPQPELPDVPIHKVSSEKGLEEKDPPKFQSSKGERDESNKGSEHEGYIGLNSEEGKISEEDLVNQTSKGGDGSEAMESDEKENFSASDANRELNNNHSERKIISRHKARENPQKVIRVLGKTSKETSASAATGAQGVIKYKKTKPTSPKPFRLRTNERGILKEANLERRRLVPLKDTTTTVPRFLDGNSQRRHGNKSHQKEESQGQCRYENDTFIGNQIESDTEVQKGQLRTRTAYLKTSKCAVKPEIATAATPYRRIGLTHRKPNLVNVQSAQKVESNSRKVKSFPLQQQLGKPQRVVPARKTTVSLMSRCKLDVIKETSSATSRLKEAAKPTERGATTTPNVAASTATASRGRRPPIIPKEPNFHSIHVPRSRTDKFDLGVKPITITSGVATSYQCSQLLH
ncbi:hypothetical protein HHK36_002788 [Tetracentron sinense]|uniref:Uncharacterized protein n=1 Tax=Tetracentron sinense TaxID=13715 RepID=A0A835DN32_TETSI|nr:hypothetical protein HHK36_002788 [Tetracentron sinense]